MSGTEFGLNRLNIVPMQLSDIRDVMAIDSRSFACAWTSHAFETELNNRAANYIVAKLDNCVLGYAGVWIVSEDAHITTLAVMPEYRSRHIGERLLIACIDVARRRKAKCVTLEVRVSNIVARHLYDKFGFEVTGERVNYYTDNGENALVMSLFISGE